MNVIGHKYMYLAFSGALVAASFAALALWGLRLGIDFTGGSMLEASFAAERPAAEDLRNDAEKIGVENPLIQFSGERDVIMRFRAADEETHRSLAASIAARGGAEKQFFAIGPTIGAELKRRAVMAVALALAGIILYLTWAFRHVSRPLASWKYGTVAVVVALFHDVVIPLGAFSALGRFAGAEADTLFVTALLTILGFSVHDTIVVFDRTRENLRALSRAETFGETVNRSVNQTMTRSVMTSFTVFLVLAAILYLGPASTRYFAFTLMVGVVFGTYSSIFVASPFLVLWDRWQQQRMDRK